MLWCISNDDDWGAMAEKRSVRETVDEFVRASSKRDLPGVKKAIEKLRQINASSNAPALKKLARRLGIETLLGTAFALRGSDTVLDMPPRAIAWIEARGRRSRRAPR